MADQSSSSLPPAHLIHLPTHVAMEQTIEQSQPPASSGNAVEDDLLVDDRTRTLIVELQKQWLTEYHNSREKALVELTEKLHQEFLNDQQKIRAELLQQFKEELEQTRGDLETKYREQLKCESIKLNERHRREMTDAKKKQWCCQCENEAIYHCCWNTAYCSVECQQNHWQSHRRACRRRRSGQNGLGGASGPGTSNS